MIRLTEQQWAFLTNKQEARYRKLDEMLNVSPTQRQSVLEQKDEIERVLWQVWQSLDKTDLPQTDSVAWIEYMDKLCLRFDSLNGLLIREGFEVNLHNGKKLFLSGDLERANQWAFDLFRLTLKKLLSQRFTTQAQWQEFA